MQFGPELVLGNAGTKRIAHPRYPRVGGRDGAFDAGNLLRAFDRARLLADGLTVQQSKTLRLQCVSAEGIKPVDGQSASLPPKPRTMSTTSFAQVAHLSAACSPAKK